MRKYPHEHAFLFSLSGIPLRLAVAVCALLCGLLSLTALSVQAAPVTFTVNSAADDDDGSCDPSPGDCTLREAINAANGNGNPGEVDVIQFALILGNTTINVGGTAGPTFGTALPAITQPVIIDGYSQPGASANTNGPGLGSNATLLVELNGSGAGLASGLHIGTGGSTVKGLVINRFSGNGILLTQGGSNTIAGNFIGTNVAGTSALANGGGIGIDSSDFNTVGGTTPAARNLISGNAGNGIAIVGGHFFPGITLPSLGFCNGVLGNLVQGNFIGTDVSGAGPLGNGSGVTVGGYYFCGAQFFTESWGATGNRIGGTNGGDSNVIAFNNAYGVRISEFWGGTGNAILGNSIFSNASLGIALRDNGVTANDSGDVDVGPNNRQNFPVLTAISGNTVQGTLNSTATTSFTLEFFANAACDPSGYGEGQTFLGRTNVTTDGSGNASFTFPVSIPSGRSFITATATNAANDTSEFSQCFQAIADLTVTKIASPDPVPAGSNLTYTVTVTNTGPASAAATLTDPIPSNTSFQSLTSPAGWVCTTPAVGGTGSVSCTSPDLGVGAPATFTLVVQVATSTAAGTAIANTATVTTGASDANAANNSATTSTTVNAAVVPPIPTPTTTPTLTPATAGQGRSAKPCTPGVATLTENVQNGSARLPVDCMDGFAVNDIVWINQGGTNSEVAQIRGFGSLLLTTGVRLNHAVGERVTRCPSCLTPGGSSGSGLPSALVFQQLYGSGYRGPSGPQVTQALPAPTATSAAAPTAVIVATPAPSQAAGETRLALFAVTPSGTTAACPQAGQWIAVYWRGVGMPVMSALGSCPTGDRIWVRRGTAWVGSSTSQGGASDQFNLESGELGFLHGAP